MTVLYLTSTGNCLYVAKKIGGELCSIPQAVKAGEYTFHDDEIGLVFPVYGLCVPPYVQKFLSKAKFKCNYLFAVITYGFYDGATTCHLLELANSLSLHFSYINTLKMIENYLPGFDMKKQIKNEPQKNINQNLNRILSDLKVKKQLIQHDSLIDQLLTKTHQKNYAYNSGSGVTNNYRIEDTCQGCGTCVQVCPDNNIRMLDAKPFFGLDCISCLGCTQNCPQNAIRLTNEKSTTRFRNQNIKLEEIIASNR